MASETTDRKDEAGAGGRRARIRSILVAVDTSPHSRAAVEAAAQLAGELGAELAGLFVEDELLLRAGRLPITREVALLSGEAGPLDPETLKRQLRAQAARARQALQMAGERAGVRWRFRSARGRVARVVLEAAEEADLVTLGLSGRSPLRGPGSTVRALLEAARHDLLILRQGLPLGRIVSAVYDGSGTGRAAVERAAVLSRREGARLVVLLVPDDPADAARLEEEADRLTGQLGVPARFRRVPGVGVADLCAAVSESGGGLLVAPAPRYRGERATDLGRLLRSARCPVVLVS